MRALFRRRKGRVLYGLWLGLTTLDPDEAHIIECLGEYLARAETLDLARRVQSEHGA